MTRAARRVPLPRDQPGIPHFASLQEEAEFWDTHDTTDYEAAFRPVQVRFARRLSRTITMRVDEDTHTRLRAAAHARGVGVATLARMLVQERLTETKPRT